VVQTAIDDWHAWAHVRTIYFFRDGPIICIDSAKGGAGRAALSWHLVGEARRDGDGLWLRRGEHATRLTLRPSAWAAIVTEPEETAYGQGQSVVTYGDQDGRLDMVSVFLFDRWVNATIDTTYEFGDGQARVPQSVKIRIQNERETLAVVHDATIR
jgi:hypothetical protein